VYKNKFTPLEETYIQIENTGIFIVETALPVEVDGRCARAIDEYDDEEILVMQINKNISSDRKKRQVGWHEWEHCIYSTGDMRDLNDDSNRWFETRIKHREYEDLVSLDSLIIGAQDPFITCICELAEWLYIPDEFLCEALKFYDIKLGPIYKYKDFIIRFNPLNVCIRSEIAAD